MSNSVEAVWQKQSEQRTRISMSMLVIVFVFLSFLIALWLLITQPLLWSGQVTSKVSVEPKRLEAHVRMLSQTLFPRDAAHLENLDRVAAYIRKEFESAKGAVSEQPYEVEGKI